jgi:DNA (cytosine-5)-methyltransferase 1
MNNQLLAFDMFQGAGGATIGLINAGFEVVGALDIDRKACNTYKTNLGIEPICADIRDISGKELLQYYGYNIGDIDLVVGCPPCQSFSSLRRTTHPNTLDARTDLIAVFAERIKEIMPKVVIFENVPGIIGKKGIPFFKKYLEKMEKLGYKTSWNKLNSADFGVPQIRNRIVALSVYGINTFPELPKKTHSKKEKKDELKKWVTVRTCIENLPPLEAGERNDLYYNHIARSHTHRIMKMIKHIPKNGGGRKDLPYKMWLECHKKLKNRKGAENIYGRLWWDRPSGTMTSRCTTPSSGRFLHPEQDRAITPREAARLQGFPDHHRFPDPFTQAEKQIGNAVPPQLIEKISFYAKNFYD